MDSLRKEIADSQKIRTDLIKWKLLLVSALAATGLGLTNSPRAPHSELVLCCIPFVCLYADSLCYHKALVLIVIGEFIKTQSNLTAESRDLSNYEIFALKARQLPHKNRTISAYDLVNINLKWSSVIFSSALPIYAMTQHKNTSIPIFISGLIGVLLSFVLQKQYELRRNKVRQTNKQIIQDLK